MVEAVFAVAICHSLLVLRYIFFLLVFSPTNAISKANNCKTPFNFELLQGLICQPLAPLYQFTIATWLFSNNKTCFEILRSHGQIKRENWQFVFNMLDGTNCLCFSLKTSQTSWPYLFYEKCTKFLEYQSIQGCQIILFIIINLMFT